MKIAICDDHVEACVALKLYLLEYDHSFEILTYQCGKDILKAELIEHFDVVIMDIQLEPDFPIDDESVITGIDIAYQMKQVDRNIILIYFSGFYDTKMVKTEPFDFLQKPINQLEINKLMDRIIRWKNGTQIKKFEFSFDSLILTIPLHEIIYFASYHRLIIIHTEESDYKYYDKLDNVQKKVESMTSTFVRVSKSYYVNMLWIDKSSTNKIYIAGEELSISRRYKEEYEAGANRYRSV